VTRAPASGTTNRDLLEPREALGIRMTMSESVTITGEERSKAPKSVVVILVERQTRYVMLARIGRDKTSAHVHGALGWISLHRPILVGGRGKREHPQRGAEISTDLVTVPLALAGATVLVRRRSCSTA